MKIYTRTGDSGTTSLPDGTRVAKTDPRIACYGALDELNAQLGWLRAQFGTLHIEGPSGAFDAELQLIVRAHRLLFSLNVKQDDIVSLERHIDIIDTLVGGIFRGFVLPGGHPVAAAVHVVRGACRRTERELCGLSALMAEAGAQAVHPGVLAYINRLSDFMFALARKVNYLTNTPEQPAAEH